MMVNMPASVACFRVPTRHIDLIDNNCILAALTRGSGWSDYVQTTSKEILND